MPVCQRCKHWPLCTCMSVADDHCGECGLDPCVCHIPASDDEDVPNELVRSTAGVKRPLYSESQPPSEEEEGELEILDHHQRMQTNFKRALHCDESYSPEPDLDAYFDEFGLSAESRIAMCRTYANYLTQKLRSSGRLGPPRPKATGQKKLGWKPRPK